MIRMTSGVYGSKDPKRPDDGPFELPAEQEARLVARGVAKYVDAPAAADHAPIGFDETPEAPGLSDLPEDVTPIPEYHTGMTAKELRDIGKLCGLTFKVGMSKEEMVAALDEHIQENTVDPDEPEEVDDAPTFDPADAVVV